MNGAEIQGLAVARFGEPNRGQSSSRELRFGHHGSVAVALAGERAGAWYDHEAGRGGWLADDGGAPRPPRRQVRERFAPDPLRLPIVRRIVESCGSPLGTPVELYLKRRGIEPPYPHSVLACADPLAMVVTAQDGAGAVLAVQVVHVTRDGRKADLAVVKRTLKGGDGWSALAAVRFPGRGRLILCEGPETGLSLWKATGRPVWACLGVPNIGRAPVWPRKAVTIARDGDEPGSKADTAALNAAAALEARGVQVRVARPPNGLDFNDLHHRDGLEAVAALLRRAGR